jgi:hypothetical protein
MQFAMMCATDGHRVFIADFSSKRTGLCEAEMMRVCRGATAYDARLPGDEFTMFLVAQPNGFGHDTAAAGADFLRTSAKTSTPLAPSIHGSAAGEVWTASLGVSLRGFVGEHFQPRLEAVFDNLRIGGPQQVLVGESQVNPIRCFVGGRNAIEFGKHTIAQQAGLFGRQNGPRGADELWPASGGNRRRRPGDKYLRFQYRPSRCILRRHAISISGRRVGDDFRTGSQVGRVRIVFARDADEGEKRVGGRRSAPPPCGAARRSR